MSKSSQIQDLMAQLGADIPTSENLNFGGNVIISSSQDNVVNLYENDQALPALSPTGTLTLEQPQPQPQPFTSVLMNQGAAAVINFQNNAGGTIIIPKGVTATITISNVLNVFEAPANRDLKVELSALTSLVTNE